VNAFNFEVVFLFGNPPPTIVYDVDVYADAAGMPGTTTCSYSTIAGTLDASATNLSIALPSACALAQGTYWVSLTPVLDNPPQSFWSNASGSAIGAEAVWRNPSGGFATACSTWSEVSTCTTSSAGVIGGGNPNFLFQVIGSVGINSGCQPSGICLTS